MRCLPVIILALYGAGCDESVNPVLEDGRPFSLYGLLNARSDTQAVRVYAHHQFLARLEPVPLDARVTVSDMTTGDAFALRDSVVIFPSGGVGHVFWNLFQTHYGHSYRLEAIRSDGAMASAEVVMPPLARPSIQDPIIHNRFVRIPVAWTNAPRLNNIRVRYTTNFGRYLYRYPLDQSSDESGQRVVVDLSSDANEIFRSVVRSGMRVADLRLRTVEVHVLVSSEGWEPPGGVYDPDLLIEPGTFSNIENGFGFVGAGYEADFSFVPTDSMLVMAGFFTDGT